MMTDLGVRLRMAAACLIAWTATPALAAENLAPMKEWITTWASTPAPRWAEELPAPFGVPELLANQTIRQVARVSVGGDKVRVVLSNEYGTKPLKIGAGSIAVAGKDGAVDKASLKPLTWGGRPFVVAPPGAPVISDPVDLKVEFAVRTGGQYLSPG